ncbi:hypothetical protein CHELA20_52949 [Hyphomicrobiales bacterium]|nr:hypothetical protein CHELA20_52949 [Hyphomicrobiales bacterium]
MSSKLRGNTGCMLSDRVLRTPSLRPLDIAGDTVGSRHWAQGAPPLTRSIPSKDRTVIAG